MGVNRTFEIQSGRRSIGVREAPTPSAALFDYVYSLGCRDSEIQRLAPDALSWRGAVFKAVLVPEDHVER